MLLIFEDVGSDESLLYVTSLLLNNPICFNLVMTSKLRVVRSQSAIISILTADTSTLVDSNTLFKVLFKVLFGVGKTSYMYVLKLKSQSASSIITDGYSLYIDSFKKILAGVFDPTKNPPFLFFDEYWVKDISTGVEQSSLLLVIVLQVVVSQIGFNSLDFIYGSIKLLGSIRILLRL